MLDTEWIASYRGRRPAADQWAAGTTTVRHTAETQERVFRMVEQVMRHSSVLTPSRIFDALAWADHIVNSNAAESAIAEAGRQAYGVISG